MINNNLINNNVVKAVLSFVWLFPFFYMFCDIYFTLGYKMPTKLLQFFIFTSTVAAIILVLIWLREFIAIRKLSNAFLYLSKGDLLKLDKIIGNSQDLGQYILNNKTLLQHAVDNQLGQDVVSYLISKRALAAYTNDKGYNLGLTLFYLASYYNFLTSKMVSFLLHLGASPNFIDNTKGFEGLSILQVFVLRADKDGINLLLENGADINYFVNDLSMNALMLAAKYVEDPFISKLLIENGADINALNQDGYNALLFAAHYNPNPAVVTVFVNYGAKIKPFTVRSAILKYNDVTPLLLAASYNNSEVVKTLIDMGDSLNYKDSFGLTPLFVAAAHNEDVDVIKALITSGAKIDNARDTEGNTPLMAASYLNSNPNVIRYLIDRSHNLKSKNKDGIDFIEYLKQNINLSEDEKRTILKWI